jgi:pSer/pThr/pTyr-binding forkhead associated (FHA) protein
MMNVRLVLERRRRRVWTTELRGPEATLGRALGCTIRVPSSEVSRQHCRLRVENGIVTVEDLESVNGTFLNGQRVRDIEIVRPGDRLELGSVTFVVEYELRPDALERLRAQEEHAVVEAADDEIEVVGEDSSQQDLPVVESVEAAQEDAEIYVLDDDAEMNLPQGGDLHDFLIELDDTDERERKHRKGR